VHLHRPATCFAHLEVARGFPKRIGGLGCGVHTLSVCRKEQLYFVIVEMPIWFSLQNSFSN
jgi:hypothetical protein